MARSAASSMMTGCSRKAGCRLRCRHCCCCSVCMWACPCVLLCAGGAPEAAAEGPPWQHRQGAPRPQAWQQADLRRPGAGARLSVCLSSVSCVSLSACRCPALVCGAHAMQLTFGSCPGRNPVTPPALPLLVAFNMCTVCCAAHEGEVHLHKTLLPSTESPLQNILIVLHWLPNLLTGGCAGALGARNTQHQGAQQVCHRGWQQWQHWQQWRLQQWQQCRRIHRRASGLLQAAFR